METNEIKHKKKLSLFQHSRSDQTNNKIKYEKKKQKQQQETKKHFKQQKLQQEASKTKKC